MVRAWIVCGLLCWCNMSVHSQMRVPSQVTFNEYRVSVRFRGRPAAPLHNSLYSREFRTVIRRAVRKGPNFADHYTVAIWGCGSGCAMFSIADVANGRVYDFPSSVSCLNENDCGSVLYETAGHYMS